MTATSSSDLKRMHLGDKEEEEEEQTSRGSPVIGKCWFWHFNSHLQLSLLDKKSTADVDFSGAPASNCDSGISDGSPGPQV